MFPKNSTFFFLDLEFEGDGFEGSWVGNQQLAKKDANKMQMIMLL